MTGPVETLRARADLAAVIRRFFAARSVLEVMTPVLSLSAVTDPAITSFALDESPRRYLRTSPEHAMKRLLCGGAPDIFELGPVFRNGELGRNHNPEFTLLEWYRHDFRIHDLVTEVVDLLVVCGVANAADGYEIATYREVFMQVLGIDIDSVTDDVLAQHAQREGLHGGGFERQALLDFLFSVRIEAALRQTNITVITHYPKAQAALAKLDDNNADYALRFEVFIRGVELANGFEELREADEQRARFEADNRSRRAQGQPAMPIDEQFLSALANGLPACSGVALGFDRLLMAISGLDTIEQAITCSWPLT